MESRGPRTAGSPPSSLKIASLVSPVWAFLGRGDDVPRGRIVDLTSLTGHTVVESALAPTRLAHIGALLFLFVVWRRCRGGAMSQRTLEILDAVLTITICGIWSLRAGYSGGSQFPLSFSMMLAVTQHPDRAFGHRPEHLQRTLWISAVSIAPTLIDIVNDGMSFSSGSTGRPHPDLFAFRDPVVRVASSSLPSTRGLFMAYASSSSR